MGSRGAELKSSPMRSAFQERRVKPRVQTSFRALVRCPGNTRRKLTEETQVENISASGLYFHLQSPVVPGSNIFALLFVPPANPEERIGARIAVRATVVRTDLIREGARGVAVQFKRYRFV